MQVVRIAENARSRSVHYIDSDYSTDISSVTNKSQPVLNVSIRKDNVQAISPDSTLSSVIKQKQSVARLR